MSRRADRNPEEEEEGRPEERHPNPIKRAAIVPRFVDGKQWTVAGIAVALGAELPTDLAVRYYRYKHPEANANASLSDLITAAKKLCVRDVLDQLPPTVVDVERKHGQKFYTFKAPSIVRLADKSTRPAPQIAPAATGTGLTTAGVLAAILKLGGSCTIEELTSELTPCMVGDDAIVAWYKKNSRTMRKAAGKKSRGGSAQEARPTAALVQEARRAAALIMCERARTGSHNVEIRRPVIITYTLQPREDEAKPLPPKGARPAPPKDAEE